MGVSFYPSLPIFFQRYYSERSDIFCNIQTGLRGFKHDSRKQGAGSRQALGRGISKSLACWFLSNILSVRSVIFGKLCFFDGGVRHDSRKQGSRQAGRGISKSLDTPQPPLIGSPSLWIKLASHLTSFVQCFCNTYWISAPLNITSLHGIFVGPSHFDVRTCV